MLPATVRSSPFFIHPYVGLVITAYTLMILAFFGLTVLGEVTLRAVSVLSVVIALVGVGALLLRYLPIWMQVRRHRIGAKYSRARIPRA